MPDREPIPYTEPNGSLEDFRQVFETLFQKVPPVPENWDNYPSLFAKILGLSKVLC